MNVPLPPTDNLYKFIAIFGLIITILSLVLPQTLIFHLETQVQNLNAEAQIIQHETTIYEDYSKLEPSSPDAKKLRYSIYKLKVKLALIDSLLEKGKKLNFICSIGLGIGILLMTLGFIFWYFRVQKYQDLILKNDAIKNKLHQPNRTRKANIS